MCLSYCVIPLAGIKKISLEQLGNNNQKKQIPQVLAHRYHIASLSAGICIT